MINARVHTDIEHSLESLREEIGEKYAIHHIIADITFNHYVRQLHGVYSKMIDRLIGTDGTDDDWEAMRTRHKKYLNSVGISNNNHEYILFIERMINRETYWNHVFGDDKNIMEFYVPSDEGKALGELWESRDDCKTIWVYIDDDTTPTDQA